MSCKIYGKIDPFWVRIGNGVNLPVWNKDAVGKVDQQKIAVVCRQKSYFEK